MSVLAVAVAYLLGSASGALLVGALRGGIDIRTLGSGNAGGTNALRTQGAGFALAVVVIDLGKGWIAAALLPLAAARFGAVPAGLPAACAFAAMVGHVWPVWHGFRGGKGAATDAPRGVAWSLVTGPPPPHRPRLGARRCRWRCDLPRHTDGDHGLEPFQ